MEHENERHVVVESTGETVDASPASQLAASGEPLVDEANRPLAMVREGMKVYDAAGDEIGKVEFVRMGDPQAATLEGQEMATHGGLVEDVAEAFGFEGEPDLPPTLAARLMRTGFMKVDGKGWIDTDRYVSAEAIATVDSESVRLKVTKEELAEDS